MQKPGWKPTLKNPRIRFKELERIFSNKQHQIAKNFNFQKQRTSIIYFLKQYKEYFSIKIIM